ncbi:MAG: mandelate racemase/muconate lactonizing enzyme family protein [Microscillaceae bacterium]|nr:mandelate racemase/muconate lactonizing enzyme family protein [Microscillaceae bacterium]
MAHNFGKLSRHHFLKSLALFPVGMMLPQTARAQKPAPPLSDVKITNVKAYVMKKAAFVKIETDAGISGWGEGDHEFSPINGQIVEKIFRPVLLNQDPFASEYLWKQAFFEGYEGGSTGFVPGALAGVDNALWDLKGRLLQQPVHKLLGGNGLEKVAVYGSYGRRKKGGFKTPDEMAREGAEFVAQGYQTIKARMQLYDRDRNPPSGFTYDCVKAIREAIGEKITLYVDFNNGYTAGRAVELGLKLYEHFNVAAIEEPVSAFDYPGLRQVVEALPCEVNAGEHEYNKWQFRDLIQQGNPDNLNLDVIKSGGLSEAKKIAALGEAFEKPIMLHNTRPTLATAASLQLLGAITNQSAVQEFSGMRPGLELQGLFQNQLRFENGFLYIPTTPGLGLEVEEKEMEKQKLNN